VLFLASPAGIVIVGRIEKQQGKRLMRAADLEDIGVQSTGEGLLRVHSTLVVDFHTNGTERGG
jgi:hypothetical protein